MLLLPCVLSYTYLRGAERHAVDLEVVVVVGEEGGGELGYGAAQRMPREGDAVDAVQVDLFCARVESVNSVSRHTAPRTRVADEMILSSVPLS